MGEGRSDPKRIVRRLQSPDLTDREREELWAELLPIIKRIATPIVYRFAHRGQDADAYVQDIATRVFEMLSLCDIERGRFEGWVGSVARNYLIDCDRKEKRRQEVSFDDSPDDNVSLYGHIGDHKTPQVVWSPTIFEARFCQADMELVRSWPLSCRLVLLAVSGLWVKVESSEWESWCRSAEVPIPFPPESAILADGPLSPISQVAEAMSRRSNTISQQWRRWKRRLRQLRAMKDLVDG